MGTHEHSAAAVAVHDEIMDAVQPIGLRQALIFFSGITIQGGRGGKQADQGWASIPLHVEGPPCIHVALHSYSSQSEDL